MGLHYTNNNLVEFYVHEKYKNKKNIFCTIDPDNSFRALSAASFVAKRTKPNPYIFVHIKRCVSFKREKQIMSNEK